jgi:hypothetical protein
MPHRLQPKSSGLPRLRPDLDLASAARRAGGRAGRPAAAGTVASVVSAPTRAHQRIPERRRPSERIPRANLRRI